MNALPAIMSHHPASMADVSPGELRRVQETTAQAYEAVNKEVETYKKARNLLAEKLMVVPVEGQASHASAIPKKL